MTKKETKTNTKISVHKTQHNKTKNLAKQTRQKWV